MDKFYPELEKRADKGDTPYNLRNCAYMEDFYKQKIIFQEMVQEPSFFLDKDMHFFCLDTARIITGKDIEFLLAVLNSKLFFFAINKFYGGGGLGESGIRMKHTFFGKFPCPVLSSNEQTNIIQLVSKIIENRKIMLDSSFLERQIDKLIYQLYNLDELEINCIENT